MKKMFFFASATILVVGTTAFLLTNTFNPTLTNCITAEFGNTNAQIKVAEAYLFDPKVERDYTKAYRLAWSAAATHDMRGEAILGYLYENGDSVPLDKAEAARWYRLAAEQGHVYSEIKISLMYLHGDGIPKNEDLAARWAKRAAEHGNAYGQAVLGDIYADGTGVYQDKVVAYKWLSLASSGGDTDATSHRDMIAQSMTPEELAEAKGLIEQWKPAAPTSQYHPPLTYAKDLPQP